MAIPALPIASQTEINHYMLIVYQYIRKKIVCALYWTKSVIGDTKIGDALAGEEICQHKLS